MFSSVLRCSAWCGSPRFRPLVFLTRAVLWWRWAWALVEWHSKEDTEVHVNQSHYRPEVCPEGSRKLRFPDYMTLAQDGGKVVSPTHRPLFTPRKYCWYSFLLEAESTPERSERLCQWKIPRTESGIEPATLRFVVLPRSSEHLSTTRKICAHASSSTIKFTLTDQEEISSFRDELSAELWNSWQS